MLRTGASSADAFGLEITSIVVAVVDGPTFAVLPDEEQLVTRNPATATTTAIVRARAITSA